MEDYKEKYEMALETVQEILDSGADSIKMSRLKLRLQSVFSELKESDEEIKEALIALVKCNERNGYTLLNNVSTSSMINWLEKQGQLKKTSIWKHWKNGICGNGEGKLVFLIKSGTTYSLSSCLSFECDYIELSELENLMLEKQDNANEEYWRGYREGKQEVLDKYSELEKQSVQNINILCWHDVSEEPEEQREIFCKWKGSIDTIWHDVAFYHSDDKNFWNGERPIEDVIKWAYVDDILKEQPQSYLTSKSASQAIQEEKIDNANKSSKDLKWYI